MIFVTIGMMYGFERLIKWMDLIALNLQEEVVIQIGNTSTYIPVNSRYFSFASRDKLNELCENARIIVCHAGVGSLLMGIESTNPVIAVPRVKELGEVIDNHQLEIAKELEKEGRIMVANSYDELYKKIKYPCDLNPNISSTNDLIVFIKNYINQYD